MYILQIIWRERKATQLYQAIGATVEESRTDIIDQLNEGRGEDEVFKDYEDFMEKCDPSPLIDCYGISEGWLIHDITI